MTARATYGSSVASAVTTANSTLLAAAVTFQESVNAGGNNIVAITGGSGNATFVADLKAAVKAALATAMAAAQAYQASLAACH